MSRDGIDDASHYAQNDNFLEMDDMNPNVIKRNGGLDMNTPMIIFKSLWIRVRLTFQGISQ